MTLPPKETDGAPPAPAATRPGHPHATPHRLARRALFSFILTFVLSRTVVVLIMSGHMPNLYFFLQGTHVHHLNYGIFLLSAVAGYAIFRRPVDQAADRTALVYGVALGLTFDEFGMWLHLGGSYWQRASIDATIVVAALIGLIAFARSLQRFEARHFWSFLVLAVLTIGFAAVLILAGNRIGDLVGPKLHALESASSP